MSLTEDEFVDVVRHTLEQRKVGIALCVDRSRLDVRIAEHTAHELWAGLSAYVLSDHLIGDTKQVKLPASLAVQFPATPWQHFKQSYCLRWWMRPWVRYLNPVRTETHKARGVACGSVTFDRYATYPESTIQIADLGRPVIFESYRTVLSAVTANA